jgi:hypothetical protein
MPVVTTKICGVGSGCLQEDDTTQSLMESSLALGDRMMVPWVPGEANFEGEKGLWHALPLF